MIFKNLTILIIVYLGLLVQISQMKSWNNFYVPLKTLYKKCFPSAYAMCARLCQVINHRGKRVNFKQLQLFKTMLKYVYNPLYNIHFCIIITTRTPMTKHLWISSQTFAVHVNSFGNIFSFLTEYIPRDQGRALSQHLIYILFADIIVQYSPLIIILMRFYIVLWLCASQSAGF